MAVLRVIRGGRKGGFVTAKRGPAAACAVSGSKAELLAAEQPSLAHVLSDLRSQGARSVSAVSSQPLSGFPQFSSDPTGGLWPRVFKYVQI